MEAVQIATLAFGFLKDFFKSGTEEFAKSSGKELWDLIKSAFSRHHKAEVISKVETNPDKEGALKDAADQLVPLLEADPGMKISIENCLKKLNSAGIYQQVTGENNISIGSVDNSSINIRQK